MTPQCAEIVAERGRGVWTHQCGNKGKNQEAGKWWCQRHTPSVIKATQEANAAKWRIEADAQSKVRRLHAAAPAMLEALRALMAGPETANFLEMTGQEPDGWILRNEIDLVQMFEHLTLGDLRAAAAAIQQAEGS